MCCGSWRAKRNRSPSIACVAGTCSPATRFQAAWHFVQTVSEGYVQIAGKISAEEFEQVRRIVWAPHYRLTLVSRYLMSRLLVAMLAVIVIEIVVLSVLKNAAAQHYTFWILGVSCCCLLGWRTFRSQRPTQKQLAKLNQTMPRSVVLGDSGVLLEQEDGVSTHVPWANFAGWQTRGTVAVLAGQKPSNFLVLPMHRCSPEQAEAVKQFLLNHIGAELTEFPRWRGWLRGYS